MLSWLWLVLPAAFGASACGLVATLPDEFLVDGDATADAVLDAAAPPVDVAVDVVKKDVAPDVKKDVADASEVSLPDAKDVADIALPEDVSTPIDPGPCPVAVITIAEGTEVTPQTVLHLSGEWSVGSVGAAVDSYQWTVTQPPGSLQIFEADSTLVSPSFLPNVVGEYTFCLDVLDSAGLNTCSKTCQKVVVVPNDALHVQLLWHTPADMDEGDSGPDSGADLDLHVTSHLAGSSDLDCDGLPDPWFAPGVDCFWFTPQLQWAPIASGEGDATLSLDDTDGAGPENFDSEAPLGSADQVYSYRLGVHYWNDHGFGGSIATVSVYVYGDLVHQTSPVALKGLDLWNVGLINWPNSAAGLPGVAVVDPCFQTAGSLAGDLCKPTTGAKAWQAKGETCIQPCYVSQDQPYGAQGKSATCKP